MFLTLRAAQLLTYITLELLAKSTTLHFLDQNQAFCGSTLAEEMNKLCLTYNVGPSNSAHEKQRGVVQECCEKRCSRRYMMENYCNQSKSLDELEQIYGDSFMSHYTTFKPVSPLELEEQQTPAPNTSTKIIGVLLHPHKNVHKPGREIYRQTIMLRWHHKGGRKKGKVPRSASTKKLKCSCRKRRKARKSGPYLPPNIGTKNSNTLYNWITAPHHKHDHFDN